LFLYEVGNFFINGRPPEDVCKYFYYKGTGNTFSRLYLLEKISLSKEIKGSIATLRPKESAELILPQNQKKKAMKINTREWSLHGLVLNISLND